MKKNRVKLISSPRSIEDVEKAISVLKERGKPKGDKAIFIQKNGDIIIYYEDAKSDEMIEENLDE